MGSKTLPKDIKKPQIPPLLGIVLGLIILLVSLLYSVTLGAAQIPLEEILTSFVTFDGSYNHLVIQTVRLPRSPIAIFVGVALAVAGALMQGWTRNSLAEPGILGIEAGAALAVVASILFLPDILQVF